jgi:hypothetical protein
MPKKQIYYYMTIFFMVFLTIASINVRAHPPSNVVLDFNSSTNTLTVTITHVVDDNTTHYISSVVISVNGSVDQTLGYSSQPDLAFFIYEYTVITNDGSTIKVETTCIEGGTFTEILGGTPVDGGIPGYMGFYLILIVSVITMLTLIRRKLKKG